jgi:hypothetical protein
MTFFFAISRSKFQFSLRWSYPPQYLISLYQEDGFYLKMLMLLFCLVSVIMMIILSLRKLNLDNQVLIHIVSSCWAFSIDT